MMDNEIYNAASILLKEEYEIGEGDTCIRDVSWQIHAFWRKFYLNWIKTKEIKDV